MTVWHGEKGRKNTGGLIKLYRKKRKSEIGNPPVHTRIEKEEKKITRTKGGNWKVKNFQTQLVNVLDPSSKKIKRVKILDVLENPANPQWVRRKIITKGTIIKTELGNARITSRPSQHGSVSAIIVEGKSVKVETREQEKKVLPNKFIWDR
jgi:small subunit ribosomal protein S8e